MKASSFCARVFFVSSLLSIFAIASSAQSSDLKNDLRSSFSKFDVIRINSGGELRSAGDARSLSLDIATGKFELNVMPNDMRSPRYRAEDTSVMGVTPLVAPAVNTYKGFITGQPGSQVRLTIDGTKIEGFFESANGRLIIEPASRYSDVAQPGDSVIYRAEHLLKQNTFFCESDVANKIEIGREMAGADRAESMMTLRVLELATEADLEWVNTLGGATQANSEILSILNMVEGTFNSEVNLSIRVVYQHTWSTADPFGGADMNAVLTNFLNYWNANNGTVLRDATHLFSGKSVVLSRGYAYIGTVCRNPGFAYGISGYVGWAPGKFLVPAHEIGHNLGADHADAAQNCANSLMNPQLTGSTPLSFCSFSRDSISAFVSVNGSCLSELSTNVAAYDFDADGRSDVSVFRPLNGVWYLNRSTTGFTAFQFGLNGDKPVAADYDGDNRADAAVYRGGVWYRLLSSTNAMSVVAFGLAGDIPSPADFDGDNKADVAVFRPETGVWYSLASTNGNFSSVRFGVSGDVPVPADYDGDGRDDINIFRPATGTWYRLNSANGSWFAMNFGLSGDKPLVGDFDGDGKADVSVWRPSNGVWYSIRSLTGSFSATAFGLSGDVPAPADFDGDGKADISVFRPSNGTWYRLNSSNGSFAAAAFGLNGDSPVPSAYLQ